jgi:hypothetical protein
MKKREIISKQINLFPAKDNKSLAQLVNPFVVKAALEKEGKFHEFPEQGMKQVAWDDMFLILSENPTKISIGSNTPAAGSKINEDLIKILEFTKSYKDIGGIGVNYNMFVEKDDETLDGILFKGKLDGVTRSISKEYTLKNSILTVMIAEGMMELDGKAKKGFIVSLNYHFKPAETKAKEFLSMDLLESSKALEILVALGITD